MSWNPYHSPIHTAYDNESVKDLYDSFSGINIDPSPGQRRKFIVGLDYGTTSSGVSICVSGGTVESIEVISHWPDRSESVWKVPSRIAYAVENKDQQENAWGYSVEPGTKSYCWTKLLLDSDSKHEALDDPALQNLFGTGLLKLPEKKTAQEVCRDFLRGVYQHVKRTIQTRHNPDVFDLTPMEIWLTVPAKWSDSAKARTLQAAKDAGFGSRAGDTVNVIPEPQAAAVGALWPYLSPNAVDPISPGENILVVDCGGGTIDIVSYTITSNYPLRFSALGIGSGAKCGSTYIDRNFYQWMKDRFPSFKNVSEKRRCPGSKFMDSFESAKRRFEYESNGRKFYISPIELREKSSANYRSRDQTIILTWDDMKELFDPVVNNVKNLISVEVDDISSKGHNIHRIVLAGGFAESNYLFRSLRDWWKDIVIICPADCQALVVKGAAIRGLEQIAPDRTYAPRHYGFNYCTNWEEGDPKSYTFTDDFDGEKLCSNRTAWVIRKGQEINTSIIEPHVLMEKVRDGDHLESRLELITCDDDEPPRYSTDKAVSRAAVLHTEFAAKDIQKAEQKTIDGEIWRRFYYQVNASLPSDGELLSFFSTAYGREEGVVSFRWRGGDLKGKGERKKKK